MNEELKIKITAVVDQARQAIKAVTNELGSFKEETEETAVSQEQLSQKVKEQKAQLSQLKKEYTNIVAAQGKQSAAAMNCSRQVSILSASYASNLAALHGASASNNVFSVSALGAAGASGKMGTAAKSASSAYETFTKVIEENIDVVSELGADVYTGLWDIIDKIGDAWEEADKAFGDSEIADTLYEIYEEAERARESFEEFDTTITRTGRKIEKEFKDGEKRVRGVGDEADKSSSKMEKLGSAAKAVGNTIGAAFKAVGAAMIGSAVAIGGLAESTREYRTEQAKLKTAFESAGSSAEVATNTYNDLYRVLGDSGQATEAAQQLAKLTTNEQELVEWTNICQGVYATFGESLPIESLTEAVNHSAKLGEVQGSLADALEWSGVNVDEFNEQLFWCNTEAEREKLIRTTLNGLYDEAAAGYEENAASIMSANEAQAKLTESLAALGAAVEPIVTLFKAGLAETLAEIVPHMETFAQGLLDVINGVEGGADRMKEGITGMVTAVIEKITELLPTLLTLGISIVTAILQGLTENFPAIAEAVGQALLQIIAAVGELLPQITEALLAALPLLLDVVLQAAAQIIVLLGELIPEIVIQIVEILPMIIDSILSAIPLLLEATITFLLAIVQAIPKIIPPLAAALPLIVTSIINALIDSIPVLTQGAVDLLLAIVDAYPLIVPSLFEAMPMLIAAIVRGLVAGLPQILAASLNLFLGIGTSMVNSIPAILESCGRIVAAVGKGLVDALKKLMKFDLELPKIKTPKFSIKPAGWKIGDLLEGVIPKLGITWNAKGGVFDKPTLMSYGDSLQGIGEDGAEAVVPLENNLEWLDKLANMLSQRMGGGDRPIVLQVDGKTFAKTVINTVNADTRQKGKLALNIV